MYSYELTRQDDLTVIDQYKITNDDIVAYNKETGEYNFENFKSSINLIENKNDNTKKVVFINNNDNQYSQEQLKYDIENKEIEIVLPLSNINITDFTINRIFTLNFKDMTISEKYNGNYYLDKLAYVVQKESNSYFSLQAMCLFRKLKED